MTQGREGQAVIKLPELGDLGEQDREIHWTKYERKVPRERT